MRQAIVALDVAKRFRLGHRRRRLAAGLTLRGLLSSLLRRRTQGTALQELWALDGVSFSVREGEAVGIIGRNGAGKSTLLKILARVTAPTRGEIRVIGRLGALLEVGTGFHPELTGRENIYLAGAVLGMSRTDIVRVFDAIVDFAEVERLVDTPVKRYSSGMSMRLAFAVAAHLEPEILVVDEVLAVGDARFQRKCLGRMDAANREGRTVLFVSHNTPAVARLCSRGILLEAGRIRADGPVQDVLHEYLSGAVGSTAVRTWSDPQAAPGDHVVRLTAVRARASDSTPTAVVDVREALELQVEYVVLTPGQRLSPNISLITEDGTVAFASIQLFTEWSGKERPKGRFVDSVIIPAHLLAEGMHVVNVAISTLEPPVLHVLEREVLAFQVVDRLEGRSARGDYAGPLPGVVRPLLHWNSRFLPE
jgi:lipopolysaccharide transport system ATP-binding protein